MTDFERMRERKDAAILRQYDEWEGIAGEFINFKPKTVLTLLAELMADQEGRKAVDIRIMKKEERPA